MFFIMGISQKEKKLNFDQLVVCNSCGRYGHIEIFMVYSYFMLFFIPIFKWNRQYYARMTCCGSSCQIDGELGRRLERGEITSIPTEELRFGYQGVRKKICSSCGFTTTEDYQYCPKCGEKFTD